MEKKNSLRATFQEGSKFKVFLISILITGLSYGLYKGMLDNFLAEVVKMGEMDRGVTEFFRELPGIALVFILAAFYMLSAETLNTSPSMKKFSTSSTQSPIRGRMSHLRRFCRRCIL